MLGSAAMNNESNRICDQARGVIVAIQHRYGFLHGEISPSDRTVNVQPWEIPTLLRDQSLMPTLNQIQNSLFTELLSNATIVVVGNGFELHDAPVDFNHHVQNDSCNDGLDQHGEECLKFEAGDIIALWKTDDRNVVSYAALLQNGTVLSYEEQGQAQGQGRDTACLTYTAMTGTMNISHKIGAPLLSFIKLDPSESADLLAMITRTMIDIQATKGNELGGVFSAKGYAFQF